MNYQRIAQRIENNLPFTHNGTLTGVFELTNGGKTYVIYSYSTEIYREYPDGQKWMNDAKYSHTTSKQQNMIRRIKGLTKGQNK